MSDERFTAEQMIAQAESYEATYGVTDVSLMLRQAAQTEREREQPAGMMGILRQNANEKHAVVLTGWESKEELERFSKSKTGATGEFDATSNPHEPEVQMREREVGGEVACAQGEAVAIVGDVFTLHWIGNGPISPIIEKHGIKPGTKLYTARRAVVPDGWRLVPVEPTEEMMDAAMQREDDEPLSDWGKSVSAPHEEIYKAMLAAAPEAPNVSPE